ncbi:MAG: sulfide/dihydroorotate dehydrogenase-like FAD/NAD-binding protein [Ignavibacteriales bacterium]|nr:sulfide/dihydroorotate dehydrogenase-like FAD/NAD-binding protein [Ignavibacteriales bacterium]
MFPILSKEPLSPTITRFVIYAPYIAKKRQAGNFVIVRVIETGERIPLTIAEGDPEEGSITLIVQAVGKTTKLLCSMGVGDHLVDVVGPLGNPTEIVRDSVVACIGGGVGTAELYPITRALREHGNKIYTIIGARSRDLIILESEMSACSDYLFLTTDDGSYKRKGLVTHQLKDLLDAQVEFDAVYAIGPLPMMKAVSQVTQHYGIKTYVSLNAVMVDGTGMCGGCRVSVNGTMKFACVDGPEFDGHKVDFDELIKRNRTYGDFERESDRRYCETHTWERQEVVK